MRTKDSWPLALTRAKYPLAPRLTLRPTPQRVDAGFLRLSVGSLLSAMGIGVFAFVGLGYISSDVRFADQLRKQHRLENPDAVFEFVISQKVQAPAGSPVYYGQSFKRMMGSENNWLWCDEGAIVIAVLAGQLGYPTRLVDLVHRDTGVSHHTIVEVSIRGVWQAYDFTGRKKVAHATDSVDYPALARARPYPQWHHALLLHNGILRLASETWRAQNWPAKPTTPLQSD